MVAPCHAVISQKKTAPKFGEIEVKTENCVKAGKMYIKNNSTYFNLDKRIFVLQFTVLFYR